MRIRTGPFRLTRTLTILAIVGVALSAAPIPPGRQHRLTIEGENTVTFAPEANLPDLKIDYKARFEYIVDTWEIKEPKPPSDGLSKPKTSARNAAASTRSKAKDKEKEKDGDNPARKAFRAVDISLHSSEIAYRQNGQPVLETKMTRTRFQGRLQPDSPILSVSAKEAPLRLQEMLKIFDTTAATLLVNDLDRVVDSKLESETPQRPVIETIVSIHSPMPKDVDSWEASSRLAMGQGQTAKGRLRFSKIKPEKTGESVAKLNDEPERTDVERVKVSGVLKGEGIIAGNFIKDGTYTVVGEQSYDPKTREWVASKWSVAVNNELANQAGLTVAQAKGRMVVESKGVDVEATRTGEGDAPKL